MLAPNPYTRHEAHMPLIEVSDPTIDDMFMTTEELSQRWRVETTTLANIRSRGEGIPFTKTPSGVIRYKLSDVLSAERDGQHGFSWSRLEDALATKKGLSLADCKDIVGHLKKNMR